MREISYEEFKEMNGNPMVGVSAPEIKYHASDSSDDLGVITESDHGSYKAMVVRYSTLFDQKRVNNMKSFNKHKDLEDAEEWLANKID